MKIKTIIFDLDDTLYDEIEFVKSGFKEVARFFSLLYGINTELFYDKLSNELKQNGRGKVFDNVLKDFNIYSKKNVKKAISIYRLHVPNISLKNEAKKILDYCFEKAPLFLVTDGNKIVQANKIKALNIEKYFKKIYITHRYGKKYAKPSPFCFLKIAKEENIKSYEAVYIADNITKDFIGINPYGFNTIRIYNGMYKDMTKSKEYEADTVIQSLKELTNILETNK